MGKDSWIALGLLCLVMVVSACAQSGGAENTSLVQQATDKKMSQTVTMLMPQGYYTDTLKKLQDKLKADENITLDIQVLKDNYYYPLVKSKIAAKEVPDLIIENVPSQYEDVNATKNIVDLSGEPWVKRLSNPDSIKAPDGNIYAWPLTSFSYYAAAYYNKKVFADLGLSKPETYAEFIQILETIKTDGNGITPIFMSNKDRWTAQFFIASGLSVLLGESASETWDKLLNNELEWTLIPEYETILNLYLNLYKKGYVNQEHAAATFDQAKEALAAGKAAIIYNGDWLVNDLVMKYNMRPDDIGVFVVPFGDKDVLATGSLAIGWLIPKDAKNIKGAKRVLGLLSQPAYMDIYFAEHPGSPGFKDVNGGQLVPGVKELIEKYIEGNKYTYVMNGPMSRVSELFGDHLWSPYIEMAAGLKTPNQVIEGWQKVFAEYMKQKNQPGF